jgi:hypothetical protein
MTLDRMTGSAMHIAPTRLCGRASVPPRGHFGGEALNAVSPRKDVREVKCVIRADKEVYLHKSQ